MELSCTLLYLEPVSVKQEALSDKAPGFHLWKATHPSNLGFEGRGEKEKEANWFISLLLNRWHWIGAFYIHSQEAQALAVVPGYRQWGPMAAPQTWLAWGRRLLLGLANCFFRLKKGIWEREGGGWAHGVTPDSLVLKTRTQLVRAQPSGSDIWSFLFFCQNHCGRRQVQQTRSISRLGTEETNVWLSGRHQWRESGCVVQVHGTWVSMPLWNRRGWCGTWADAAALSVHLIWKWSLVRGRASAHMSQT